MPIAVPLPFPVTPPGPTWVPLLSGLLGTLVGAFTNAILRDLADRRAAREALVGEVAVFTQDCISALLQFYHASRLGPDKLDKWARLAALEQQLGKGMALEVRIFREMRSRKVRVAFRKILNRVGSVKAAISQPTPLAENLMKLGLDWIDDQRARAGEIISKAAGIDMIDRARFIFVGPRKVTLADRLALSFDDEALPWEYALAMQFRDDVPPEGRAAIQHRTRERVGDMRCPKHGHAPHVVLSGLSSNLEIGIESCCEPFMEDVRRAFLGASRNAGREKAQ